MKTNRIFVNLDQDEGIYFERELDFMKARSYDVQFPELLARRLFPVDSSADPGADTISYQTWTHMGAAQVIHSYANDLKNIEVSAKLTVRQVYSEGISFSYSIQDVRAAKFAGKPLNDRKATSCRRQMLSLENKIAFFGNDSRLGVPSLDFEGFVNNSLVNTATATGTWATSTPDEIIEMVQDMASTIRSTTSGIESPNTLLIPEAQFGIIATTPRSAVSDTTIMDFILKTNPWVKEIIPVYNLQGAAGTEGSPLDVAILYDRSPDKLTMEIPQDVEFLPPQEMALSFSVPVHARTAGVILYYPLAVCQMDGI